MIMTSFIISKNVGGVEEIVNFIPKIRQKTEGIDAQPSSSQLKRIHPIERKGKEGVPSICPKSILNDVILDWFWRSSWIL